MTHVIACIDGSRTAQPVCDGAAWAAEALDAPLTLLHVLDPPRYTGEPNLSGSLELGARENLLIELVELEGRMNRLALEEGKLLLEAAREQALSHSRPDIDVRQRHGDLLEALTDLEDQTRLLVIGKQGEAHTGSSQLGDNVERVIRAMQQPVLVVVGEFFLPRSVMLAFDNSATTRKGVEMVATSPLLKEVPCHVVSVNGSGYQAREGLAWAEQRLHEQGHDVVSAALNGDVDAQLHGYQADHDMDMIIMGAYGHSRVREFLIGSTTDRMIRKARVPLLILR